MTNNTRTDLMNHFSASSGDITPVAARGAACLIYAPVSRDLEVIDQCSNIVSEQERQRSQRFTAEYDRGHFLQRRAFRRFCASTALDCQLPLSAITFQETTRGRPYLADAPDLWFSFSSCRSGFLGAWSSTHGIGVDLEEPRDQFETTLLADRFFSRAEAEAVARAKDNNRLWTFLQLWTFKEAALKSIGEGLPYGLDAFEFELEPVPRLVTAPPEHGGAALFAVYPVDTMGCCAALVIRNLAAEQ